MASSPQGSDQRRNEATPRRSKGRAREESVVAAAGRAIADLGIANVRIADIAERAGIGPGHVTYYFPSKDELLMRAVSRSEEQLHERIEARVHRIADPWQRLRTLVELAMPDGPGDPAWVLWLNVWAAASASRAVAARGDALDRWWRVELVETIRYGCDCGTFATDDLDATALTLSALIDGLSVRLTLDESDISRSAALDLAMSAARRYLA